MNGERNPSEVYVDFREAVYKILGLSSGEVQEKNVPQPLEAEVSPHSPKQWHVFILWFTIFFASLFVFEKIDIQTMWNNEIIGRSWEKERIYSKIIVS